MRLFVVATILAFVAAFRPDPVAAQPLPARGDTLPEIVVLGSAVIETAPIDPFGSIKTVVTERQLSDLNAIDLAAALRRTPGVTISRFNPVGSFGGDEGGAVFIRGMGASRPGSEIKTYIDGAPFYMGVWNHSLLDLLPLNGVARIDVHKGPQPQAFGNTFAAIDVAPVQATEDGVAGNLRLSGGSFGTLIEQGQFAVKTDRFDATVSQGFARSDGHREDADGRLLNGIGRFGFRLNDAWKLGLTVLHADNTASDPGRIGAADSKTGRFDTRGTLAGLTLSHTHGKIQGSIQGYANDGAGDWVDNPAQADVHSTFRMSGIRWRERVAPWPGGTIEAGLDLDRLQGTVTFDTFEAFDGETQQVISGIAGLSQVLPIGSGWEVVPSAGVRLYGHSVLAGASAPYGGIQVGHADLFSLRFSAARGINYPGLDAALLNTIVEPLAGAPDSWRDLEAETLNHLELGARTTAIPGGTLDVTLFEDRFENRYVFAFPPAVSLPSFTNLGAFTIQGLEAYWQQELADAWSFFAGLTLLDASIDTHPYVPEQMASFGLVARFAGWRFAADAQVQSDMFVLSTARADGAANTEQVDGFSVLNLRVGYTAAFMAAPVELFIALENVLDAEYAFRPDYPMPGRGGQLGVSVAF